VVTEVAMGYASIIYLILLLFESESESGLSFVSLSSDTMTVSSDIHQCCAKGFCGSHTTSYCPSSSFHFPSFPVAWAGCLEVECFVS
jgi:hypothetical protein